MIEYSTTVIFNAMYVFELRMHQAFFVLGPDLVAQRWSRDYTFLTSSLLVADRISFSAPGTGDMELLMCLSFSEIHAFLY